jgi:hypothetical protein
MRQLALEIGVGCVDALKVPAHTSLQACNNDLERWLITGNDLADKAAKSANAARPAGVWTLWDHMAEQLCTQRAQADLIRAHIVAVAKLWQDVPNAAKSQHPLVSRPLRVSRVQPTMVFTLSEPLVLVGPTFRRSFGLDLFTKVARWISCIRAVDSELRWISFHHLFISFQKREGPVHMSKLQGVWKVETGELANLANHVRLGVRVKHFRLMLQQFLRDCAARFVTATLKPDSQWVSCFKGSLAFGITQEEYDFIEGFLAAQLKTPAIGSGKSLDMIRSI